MAAASGDSIPLSEVDRRVLECAICQERYKSPKILNCHHSFCKPCLDEWVKANKGKLCCPSCRTECPLPSGGVSRLRDNSFLNDLIDVIMESGSTTKSTKCESCKETDASHWCKDCAQFFCSDCDGSHETIRLLRGHVRMSIKEYNETKETEHFKLLQPRFCDVHPSSQLEFFCDSCQHPVCLKCTIISHKPPQHDVISTDEALQKYTPSIKKYADELGNDVAELKDEKRDITDESQSFSQSHKEAKAEIEAAAGEAQQKIKTRKTRLLQILDQKYRTHEKQIQAELENLDCRLGTVDSMHSYLTHVLRYGNAVDILSAKKPATKALLDKDSLALEVTKNRDYEQQLLFKKSDNLLLGEVVCKGKENVHIISKDGISKLTDGEISELANQAKKYDVILLRTGRAARLRLVGCKQAVAVVQWEVDLKLDCMTREEIQNSEKERKWSFWDENEGFEEYDTELSEEIEQAYCNRKSSVTVDIDGGMFKIDFSTMTEIDLDDRSNVAVRRTLKESGFRLPRYWLVMAEHEQVKTVVLDTDSAEYANVATVFMQSFQPPKSVQKIERIQNPIQFRRYMVLKQKMDMKNKPCTNNERLLYHGTVADDVDKINLYGFNRSLRINGADSYGRGSYFAVSSNVWSTISALPDARTGLKYMYQAKVLTGEFARGANHMLVPPQKSQGDPTDMYDSVTDNVKNPSLFVIFNDAQAYPEYLITYK